MTCRCRMPQRMCECAYSTITKACDYDQRRMESHEFAVCTEIGVEHKTNENSFLNTFERANTCRNILDTWTLPCSKNFEILNKINWKCVCDGWRLCLWQCVTSVFAMLSSPSMNCLFGETLTNALIPGSSKKSTIRLVQAHRVHKHTPLQTPKIPWLTWVWASNVKLFN